MIHGILILIVVKNRINQEYKKKKDGSAVFMSSLLLLQK